MKQISQDRWEYMLEVLPPLYVKELDGKPIENGICCSEAYTHNDKGVVLTICYKADDGNYYEGFANVFTKERKPIWDTYNHCYTTVIAESCELKQKITV